jgi:phage FluMu protein Com
MPRLNIDSVKNLVWPSGSRAGHRLSSSAGNAGGSFNYGSLLGSETYDGLGAHPPPYERNFQHSMMSERPFGRIFRSFRRDDERYFGPSEDFTSFHASFPSKELEMTLVNDMRLSTAFREVFTNFSSKKNLSVTPQKVGKDEGVAKKNKIAAALFVMESEDSKVFDLYNEAVRHCKDKSEMLGNIYAARSGIFFNVGNRQKCLEEIDRALKCEIPQKLKDDLLWRKYECMRGVKGSTAFLSNVAGLLSSKEHKLSKEAKHEVLKMGQYGYDHFGTPKPKNLNPVSHPDDIAVKISGKENLLISGASDGLMLKFLPERGRFYVATRQIQPGEILIVEKPYACVLFAENWETHCQYCADPVKNGIPCTECASVIFCSDSCRSKAHSYHSIECNHMMNLAQFACTGGPYLAYRMITAHPLDYFLQRKDIISELRDASTKVMPLDYIESNEYVNVYCLTDHAAQKSPEDIKESMITAVYMTKLLERGGYFGLEPRLEDKIFICMLLLRNIMIFDCSYFTYHERTLNDHNTLEEPPDRGMAIFSAASLANHSCAPNMSHYFINGHIVFRAMGVIDEGQQCSISYGDYFMSSPLYKRLEYLAGYFFDCDCPACKNEWSDNLDQMDTKLRCPHCKIDVPAENVEAMKDLKCPSCKLAWKTFVDQFINVKKEAFQAAERINTGNVSQIKDDIWKLHEYLKALYVVTVQPNRDYWTIANDLSYQHIVESLLTQKAADEAPAGGNKKAGVRKSSKQAAEPHHASKKSTGWTKGRRSTSRSTLSSRKSDIESSERSLPPPPGGNYGQYGP